MSSERVPGVSLLVCTYNRKADLLELLDTALTQETGGAFHYEVLVVDNNSKDGTRDAVEGMVPHFPERLRYFFEPRQGKSFALNRALAECRTDVCSIGDDDLLLPPGYVSTVWRLFQENPEISLLGGKVLPKWTTPPPEWLTAEHWPPLALCDFGEAPVKTSIDRPVCLMAASFRTGDLLASGLYAENLAVKADQIGGVEDAEMYLRMYRQGCRGLYHPSLYLHHKVEPERVTRAYHRRWHAGHGRNRARLRDPEFEKARFHVLGVPAHVLRSALLRLCQWITMWIAGRAGAFQRELEFRFFAAFMAQRIRDGAPARQEAVP